MSSLSSYFNNTGTDAGVIDQFGFFTSNNPSNSNSKSNTLSKGFQNQYYQDALKNPDNYTWGVWDSNKDMTTDNWQPKPRQAGDARDPRSPNYQQPMTYSSTVTGTGHAQSTSNNNSSNSNGTVSASNNNWTLPAYNYDPNLTWSFLNATQSNSYNPQGQQALRDNQNLSNEDAWSKLGVANATAWQAQQRANSAGWQAAAIEKYKNTPTSFSYTTVLDPNSKAGWDTQIWENRSIENQIRAGDPARKSAELIAQTQTTGNVQAAQAQAQGYVEAALAQARGNIDTAKATSQGNIDTAKVTSEGNKEIAKLQTDVQKIITEMSNKKDVDVAGMQTAIQKQIAELSAKSNLDVATLQSAVQQQIAQMNTQAQMYGSQMGAISGMFGSQMGALGNMFGGMRGGGSGGRYW